MEPPNRRPQNATRSVYYSIIFIYMKRSDER